MDRGSGEVAAQAETDEARRQGTRHSSAAQLCCQPGLHQFFDDRITSPPELRDRCVTSFLEKKDFMGLESLKPYFVRVIEL